MTGRTVADAAGSAMSATDPDDLLRAYEAASIYYIQGETMEAVAYHLGVSRSTVSRLLARARQEDVVWVSLVQPEGAGPLEGRMTQVFGVRTHVVPVREGITEIHHLEQVASVAAAHMVDLTKALTESGRSRGVGAPKFGGPGGDKPPMVGEPVGSDRDTDAEGTVVGVAWDTTMSKVSTALPSRSVPGPTVVQPNGVPDPTREGSSAGEVLSRVRSSLGMRTISLPVPTFFDHVATRGATWSKRSVKRVLSVVRRVSLTVFGVDALDTLNGALPSRAYKGGHLTARDQAMLRRQNMVGDMCTVLLRADGSWCDVTLNARATGPTPAQLARVPHHLCVAAGAGRPRALLAALRAQTAMDLVVNDTTTRVILEPAEARG